MNFCWPHRMILLLILLTLLLGTHARPLAQTADVCVDLTQSLQCKGLPNFKAPKDISAWAADYYSLSGSALQSYTDIGSAERFDSVFLKGLNENPSWTLKNLGCRFTASPPRWFRSEACISLSTFAADKCPGATALKLCPKYEDEFRQMLYEFPRHQCDLNNQTLLKQAINARLENPKSCIAPSSLVLENPEEYCGYAGMTGACYNSCQTTEMQKELSESTGSGSTCAGRLNGIKPLPLYSSTRPAVGTDSVASGDDKSASTTASGVDAKNGTTTKQTKTGTQTSQSAMEKVVGGMQVKMWIAIGAGIFGVIVLGFAGFIIRHRSLKRQAQEVKPAGLVKNDIDPNSLPSQNIKTLQNAPPIMVPQSTVPPGEKSRKPAFVRTYIEPTSSSNPQYASRVSSFSRGSYASSSMTPSNRRAIISYMPRVDDELEIHEGDRVIVLEEYGDGYALGENLSTGLRTNPQGVFPLMCLDEEGPSNNRRPISTAPSVPAISGPYQNTNSNGIRETEIRPNAQRFTQYTVTSDFSDDDEPHRGYRPPKQQAKKW